MKLRKTRHPDCYANALGGCGQKLTREHYVSACVLEIIDDPAVRARSVHIRGLSFQKPGEVKALGVASLTGKILCEPHNTALSGYDAHGKEMFLAMQGFTRAALDPTAGRVWRIDGDMLERWLLKVLSGGLYCGAFPVGPGETLKGMVPSRKLLRVLFRGKRLPAGWGLYQIPQPPGQGMCPDENIMRMEALRSPGTPCIGGIRVFLFGFQFALLVGNTTPELSPLFAGASYRPEGLANLGNGSRVVFDWAEGPKSPPVLMRAEAAGPFGR